MTTVHTSPDYKIQVKGPPPPGYPVEVEPDHYDARPFAQDLKVRRAAFLKHILRNPAPQHTKAAYYELARLAAGGIPHQGVIRGALEYIDRRMDCADFSLHSILRMLYQFGDHPKLSQGLLDEARETVLTFKYWPDEPGLDSMCTWTENHQILFASGAYLAGQLYPGEVFSNSGFTGREQMANHRPRIARWLDLRFRTGFSEWLSHVYYDEDLTALLSLVDFCHDEEIRARAEMVTDLLLFDMALHNFQGVFGSTHGRSYENTKKWAAQEGTTDTQKLLFGMGAFSLFDNMSAVPFALSPMYRIPEVIVHIANDRARPGTVNSQRMGLRIDEADRWGVGFENFEDGMVMLSLEAYAHPKTISLVMDMFDAFNWWQNDFFRPFARYRGLLTWLRRFRLLPAVARLFEKDLCRNTREEVNLYTYRTPDYMLSTAQDYRAGFGGDQQHIWQATLDANAVCFTTHPPRREGATPNYWAGSGTLPRATQIENVAIIVYKIASGPALYVQNELFFTHAWLPRDQFDQVVELEGWIFARKGEGYLALRSARPYHWQSQSGEDQNREIVAPGKENIWLCELGRRASDGVFENFVNKISQAPVRFEGLTVRYQSPSQGLLEFGWQGQLKKGDKVIHLGSYPRYDNPYAQADFPMQTVKIHHGNLSLVLDWRNSRRRVSGSSHLDKSL